MNAVKKPDEVLATENPGEDRIIMLSDGVFAIAITLLVIDINLPQGLASEASFNQALGDAFLSKALIYAVTFIVIASNWMIHRRMVRIVRRVDKYFLWLNLLFLAFIAFFPVVSNLLDAYGRYPRAIILYTLVLTGCGFSALFIWLYASWHHRLIDADLDREYIRYRTINMLCSPLVYIASLALLPFFPEHPSNIFFSWLLLAPIYNIIGRIYRRRNPDATNDV